MSEQPISRNRSLRASGGLRTILGALASEFSISSESAQVESTFPAFEDVKVPWIGKIDVGGIVNDQLKRRLIQATGSRWIWIVFDHILFEACKKGGVVFTVMLRVFKWLHFNSTTAHDG